MKKMLFFLLFSCISIITNAQLSNGKYEIHGIRCLIDGETSYSQTFDLHSSQLRVTDESIFVIISGYFALTYGIKDIKEVNGNYVYQVIELQSGKNCTLIFHEESPVLGTFGGILIVNRSDYYTDVFSISKQKD